MNLFYGMLKFLVDNPGYNGEIHPGIKVISNVVIGVYTYDIIADDELLSLFIDSDSSYSNHYGIRLYVRSLVKTTSNQSLEISNHDTDNFRSVQYDIMYGDEEGDMQRDAFNVQYNSEESVFQQTLLHDFDSTNMKYVFALYDEVRKFIGSSSTVLVGINPNKLEKICKTFQVEVKDDYY